MLPTDSRRPHHRHHPRARASRSMCARLSGDPASARRARPLGGRRVGAHADGRHFDVSIRVLTHDARGVLAKVANAIAENNANIRQVRMDAEQVPYSNLQSTLQVTDRIHLARLLRASGGSRKWYASCGPGRWLPLAERAPDDDRHPSHHSWQPGRIPAAPCHVLNQRPPQIAQLGVAPQDDPLACAAGTQHEIRSMSATEC